jgi:sec-independent protein translocase protein TatA
MNLGPVELLVILGIVLLLFGAKKLPELARSLGKSTKEFKSGMREGGEATDDSPTGSKVEDKTPEQRPL